MRRIFETFVLATVLLFAGVAASAQEAEQKQIYRYALVIGNKAYSGNPWRELNAPARDAATVRSMLEQAGFEITDSSYRENASGKDLRNVIDAFGTKVRTKRRDILVRDAADKEGIVAVVFFSGHGFMVGDSAYLAGVDAKGRYVEDIVQQSVKLSRLVQDLTPDERDVDLLSIFLIDACRSAANLPSRVGSATKGLTSGSKNPFSGISGFGRISVFATTDGKASLDARNNSEHSVFTSAMLEAASRPDAPRSFSDFVKRVELNTPRIAKARFNTDQFPEVYSTGASYDFYWSPGQERDAAIKVGTINENRTFEPANREGWIWIGDYSVSESPGWAVSRFAVAGQTELPPPRSLKAGQEIEIKANLNVRDRFPVREAGCLGKYHDCAKLLGTLPKGLKVVMLGDVKSVGQQYWIKVKFNGKAIY